MSMLTMVVALALSLLFALVVPASALTSTRRFVMRVVVVLAFRILLLQASSVNGRLDSFVKSAA